MANHTAINHNDNDHLLDYFIPIVFLLFLILFLLLCCVVNPRLRRRCLTWLGVGQSDLTEPLIDEETSRSKDTSRGDFLIKRCDQTSTRKIEDRILERLQRDCRVVERSWKRHLDDGQLPVIVFCVISSRIGTDIENAMRGVHGSSIVILVLLHSVLKDLLRGDLSDDEELLDPTTRKRMTGIAHFAFSDRDGLYICRQNDIGFDTLGDVIRSLV